MVNVALPTLSRSFAAPIGSVSGVVTAYLVTLAVAMPASGWIGDRFGGRNVLLAAITRVHRRVGAVRAGDLAARAGRVPRAAGARRRDPGPGRDDDDHPGVPAGRAGQGQPGTDRADAAGARARPGDRRRAGRRAVLAVDLLHQPAGRRGRARWSACCSCQPGPSTRPAASTCPASCSPAAGFPLVLYALSTGSSSGWGSARARHRPARPGAAGRVRRGRAADGRAAAAAAALLATGCSGSPACSSPPRAAGSSAPCSSSRCCCRTASASPPSTRGCPPSPRRSAG